MQSDRGPVFNIPVNVTRHPATPTQRKGGSFLNISALKATQPNNNSRPPLPPPKPADDDLFTNLPPIENKATTPAPIPLPPRKIQVGKPEILNFDTNNDSEDDKSVDTFFRRPVEIEELAGNRHTDEISPDISQRNDMDMNLSTSPADSSATMPNTPIPEPRKTEILFPPLPSDMGSPSSGRVQYSASSPVNDYANRSLPPQQPNLDISMNQTEIDPVSMIVTSQRLRPQTTPGELLERNFNSSLDRYFNSLKRNIVRDIANAFRPSSSSFDSGLFDTFITQLISELSTCFDPSQLTVTTDDATIIKRATQTFDDSTKTIRRLFSDAQIRNTQLKERRMEDLKLLQNSINDLKSTVKSVTEATLHELERERYDSAAQRDEEQTRSRNIERRARTLKLKSSDLESRLNHQKLERESVDNLLKQMEETRREWEEWPNDNNNNLYFNLRQEMDQLRSELSNEATERLNKSMTDCTVSINQLRNGLREEISEMEFAEKWTVSKLRSPMRRTPGPRIDQNSKTPLIEAAQKRIQDRRRQSAQSMKAISDHIDVLSQIDQSTQ